MKKNKPQKYVTYDQGIIMYSMGICTLMKLARAAGAVTKVKGRVLIDCTVFDEYLEQFRVIG